MKAKKKRPKVLAPYQARGVDDVCLLNRDNISTRSGWILVDGYQVHLTMQLPGTESVASVHFKPKEFERFARWYLHKQKVRQART